LKEARDVEFLIWSGIEFQMAGAAEENARLPKTVAVRG
jgi:hypothetical protein